jgi:hypothetical protein
VALAFGFRNAEPTERAGHGIARVIGDDQEWRGAVSLCVTGAGSSAANRLSASRSLVLTILGNGKCTKYERCAWR